MKIDLHCHSKYSHDNYLDPEDLIEEAVTKGLDGICFTEHYSIAASLQVERIGVPDGFYVFRGLEISTNQGHMLVYGLKDDTWNIWSRNNYLDLGEVISIVHKLGGICAPAHPFRGWDSIGEAVLEIDAFDAIETHNGQCSISENQKAEKIANIKNIPSVGGSDCHIKGQVGVAYTEFKNPVFTINQLVTEIKNNNCKGVIAI